MKIKHLPALACAVAIVTSASSNLAAGESEKQLLAQAKITRQHAEEIALAAAHGGKIKSSELEREKGHLVWSFDIMKPHTSNITEVLVDAKTGQIVAVQKEHIAEQASEARADAREKR